MVMDVHLECSPRRGFLHVQVSSGADGKNCGPYRVELHLLVRASCNEHLFKQATIQLS